MANTALLCSLSTRITATRHVPADWRLWHAVGKGAVALLALVLFPSCAAADMAEQIAGERFKQPRVSTTDYPRERRVELRRALATNATPDAGVDRKHLPRDRREKLNRELRETLRDVYEPYEPYEQTPASRYGLH